MLPITSNTEWTQSLANNNLYFRFAEDRPRFYRKEIGEQFYGGHCIHYCHPESRIAQEWLHDNFKP